MADDSSRVTRALAAVAPDFVRRRYAAKFAIAFLAVVLVIAATGAVAFQQTSATVERQTEGQLQEVNRLKGVEISTWVSQMRTYSRSISRGEPLQSDRRAAPYILLQDQLLPEDVVSMHFVNRSRDEVVASTELPLEGRSLGDFEALWTNAVVPEGPGENSEVWQTTRSYRSPVLNDEPVMAFASSVPQRDGSYLVVVARIQGVVSKLEAENTTERTTILNADNQNVLNLDRVFDEGAHADELGVVRSSNGSDAATTASRNGRLYAYTPVPNTDWVAVTSAETSEAFSVRDTVGQTVGAVVLLALVSLGIVGLTLGRHTLNPLKELKTRAQSIENGDFGVDLSTGRVDEMGELYASFDDMRDSLQERIDEAENAVAEAEAAREEAESLREDAEDAQAEAERAKREAEEASQRLQKRASDYSDVMQAVAAGDLTRRLDEDADEEAMRDIAREFNAMLDQIEATVAEVAAFADEVATASLEVATGAEEIEQTSQTVSERIQEIADGAIRQHDDLQDAAGEMDQLSASIQEVAASSATVAETAEDAVERGEAGRDAAESAIDDMAEIESRSAEAVDQILRLQDRMEEIGEIVEFITDIAEQTNMLALNANIEAARAGGNGGADGDGFEVVADEVKSLAEETKDAASEIEAEIEAVQRETDETVADIRATSDHIESGVETVREAANALEDTVDAIEDANHGIQEISDATDDQADATQRVVRRVDEVADISEEVTEGAEQVSAAAEEQSASVAEIAHSADDLQDRADALSASVDEFDVRDADNATADAAAASDDTGGDTSATDSDGDSATADDPDADATADDD
jgi:methyl-accepting chemotaxis protein